MPSQYLENLANLSDLTVANIMKELKGRYDEKEIYVRPACIISQCIPERGKSPAACASVD